MRKRTTRSSRSRSTVIAAICNVLGVAILLAVILTAVPLCLPKLLGYQVYHVVSPSMSPAIPMGSVVYVAQVEPEKIQPEDVIAFRGETGAIITHRVVRNQIVEGKFITKGDANEREDAVPVGYDALYGRVTLHIPVIGRFLQFFVSSVGKLYAIVFAACGLMFNLLGNRLRDRAAMGEDEDEPQGSGQGKSE